jgi:hypothetical protein
MNWTVARLSAIALSVPTGSNDGRITLVPPT